MTRSFPNPHPASLWRGADFGSKDDVAFELTAELWSDLEAAARYHAALAAHHEALGPDDLPLGPLAERIDELQDLIMAGRGFAILRGIPVDRLSPAELELALWSLGLRLGQPLSQSVMGERIGHVIDVTDKDPHARAYRNNSELTPHSDPGDMLIFLCRQAAKSGGISRFTSSMTVYEEIRQSRPDLLARLFKGYRYHRLGEQGEQDEPITPHRVPVYSERDGHISCRCVRIYIDVAAKEDPANVLDPEDREALDLLEALARRQDLQFEFTLEPGEAVIANNYTVLHARTAFEDHADPVLKRHLLRLWLAAEPPRPVVSEIHVYKGGPGIPAQPGRTPSYDHKLAIDWN